MSIKIELEKGKNIYLESDEKQFVVKKYGKTTTDKEGNPKESYTVVGYYTNLNHVFNAMMKRKMLTSNATSFKELIEEVKAYKTEIQKLLSDVE